ncbi:MAG: glucans biosynthesis glucosyltransferase, partial [Pseudomonadota bacterium]
QHLRVALAQGFKPMSRMHMWVGAGAYLAGPAWLCFTVLGAVLAATTDHALVPTAIALPIMLATAAMLLGPRVFGVIATLAWRSRRVAHGGAFFVILSGLCELLLGSLLAPLMMVHHTRIVVSILTGSSIRWGAQNRRAGGKRAQIVRSELFSTFLGIAAATSLQLFAPQLLLWLAPIWAPLVLAIPLAMLVSSPDLGKLVARSGIFTTPSETEPDDLLLQAQHFRALTKADEAARFRDLVLDPLLLTAQLKKLQAAREDANQSDAPAPDRAALDMLLKRALRVGPAALADAERVSLAQDADSLRTLHREAWRHWPVESWQLARHVPQLPNDDTPPALRTSLTSLVPVRVDAQ